MDASFLPVLDYGAITDVIGSLEPDVRSILGQLEAHKSCEVFEEVLKRCDLGQMRNARMSVFRAAMDKVDQCLNQAAILKGQDNETTTEVELEIIKKAEELYRSLKPSDMISRRCVKNMTSDLFELLFFVAGRRVEFPTSIIKTLPSPGTCDSIIDGAVHFPFNRVIDAYTHEDEESSKSYASSGDEISEPDTSSLIQEGEDTNTEDEQCGSDSDDASHIQTFDNERFADILDDIHSFIGEDTLTRITPTPDVSHKTCKKTIVVEGDMIAAAESVDIYAVPPSGQVARDQPTTNDPDVAKKRNAAREQPTTDESTIRKKGQAVREQPTTVPKKGEAVRDQPTTDTSSGAKNQRYKDHGGARPKAPNSLGKGNVKTLNNNAVKSNVNAKRGNGPSNGDKEGPADKRGESYAKVASKNKWKTVGSKKRKYDKVSPKG